MINKLTPEQEQAMYRTRDEWIEWFYRGDPIDEKKAIEGVNWLYELSGFPRPRIIIVKGLKELASISDSIRASISDSIRASIRDSISDSIWASIRASIWDSISDSVRASIRDSIRASISDSIRDSISDSIWASIRDSIRASIWDSISDSIRASIWASIRDSIRASAYGNYTDYGWVAYESFCDKQFGTYSKSAELKKFREFLRSGVFATIQGSKTCIVVSIPKKIYKENNLLHSETSPAVEFYDGSSIYALKGVKFEKDLWSRIVSRIITAQEATELSNAEQRIIAIKYLGGDRLMKELKGKIISHDASGELLEFETLKANYPLHKMFRGFDPSKNEQVYLWAKNEHKTAKEFCAWSYGLNELKVEYLPVLRT